MRWPAWTLGALLLVAWETVVRLGVGVHVLPTPTAVLALGWTLLLDGTLIDHAWASGVRIGLGVGAAVLLGVPMGLVLGLSRRTGPAVEAAIRLLRPIPPVAWIPISILWFRVSDLQQYFIVFVGAWTVVSLGSIEAVRRVPDAWVRAARNLGASRAQLTRHVLTWGAGADIFTAVRRAFAVGWWVIVAAEFVSAPDGIGFLILEGRNLVQPERVFLGMACLGGLSWATDLLISWARPESLAWSEA